ncbi:hypothetical protein C9426_24165 [Serratia sp. S1B]|nr:hypothetical protein C9426_24165 [Serratia sp. S1B]
MSQKNSVTSSKREYRKGNPLSGAEKQRVSVARKRARYKEVKVFIDPQLKAYLVGMCAQDGATQAELVGRLIEREAVSRSLA